LTDFLLQIYSGCFIAAQCHEQDFVTQTAPGLLFVQCRYSNATADFTLKHLRIERCNVCMLYNRTDQRLHPKQDGPNGKPLICMPPPANVSVTLNFE